VVEPRHHGEVGFKNGGAASHMGKKQKAREDVPGFDLCSVFLGLFGVYPNSWTESAETSMVFEQQHAQVGQAPGNTV